MDFRQLTSFIAVARFNNFSKAAEFLNYSQSTVSEQILALEKDLGIRLFERLGRTITLTPDGAKLLPYAEQVTGLCKEIPFLFTTANDISGTVSVAAAETLCTFHLPILLKDFKLLYPNIQISLKMDSCTKFPDLLRKNMVDIVLTMNDESLQPDFVCKKLFSEPTILICSPTHPLSQKFNVTPLDLNGQNLILSEEGCGYRTKFEAVLKYYDVKPMSIVSFGSVDAIKQCVKYDLGISFLPQIAVEKEIAAGELVQLNWQVLPILAEIQMAYHKNKWCSPALQAFIDKVYGEFCINKKANADNIKAHVAV